MNSDIFAVSDPINNELQLNYRKKSSAQIVLSSKEEALYNGLVSSTVAAASSECLCKSVSPLVKLGQLFGVIPLVNDSVHGRIGKQSQGQECGFSFRFSSLPNLINGVLFVLYAYSLVWCYLYYRDTLVDDFQGTDLYAHEFKVDTTVVAGTVIVLVFRLKYGSFIKCMRVLSSVWSTLDGVGEDHDDAVSPTSRSRLSSPATMSKIGAGLICLNVALSGLVGTFRFGARYSLVDSPTLYVVQVLAITGLTALQQCVAFVFAVLCWITKSLFVKLSDQLRYELGGVSGAGKVTGAGTRKISGYKLEQIRLLHNALCNSNKYMSGYFGLPVLGICCTGVIAITCGIYNFIFSEETLFDGQFDEQISIKKLYYIMFVFEMYFAVLAIGLILVSGQMLSNSVSSCIDAIHDCNLMDLDEKSEFQVMVCLQSIKASSGKLTASNMATIGMGFIASAVTNTTTYILVLLQFRLGGDDSGGGSSEQGTNPASATVASILASTFGPH